MVKSMEHKDYKEMIQFYLYEELDEISIKIFKEHINVCNECRQELELYKKLFSKIEKDAIDTIDPKLLLEARAELRGYIRAQKNNVPIFKKIFDSIASYISKPMGFAVSGISVLVFGIFIGYSIFKEPLPGNMKNDASLNKQLKISNINFIDPDPSDGQVEFTFDAINSGHIKGKIDSPELQSILTYAVLNEQNPGTRLNSINVLNAAQKTKTDDEIKKSIMKVTMFDENPGVRREALVALKEIPFDEEIKNTFLYVLLNDTSSGLRIEAINSLVEASKKGFSFSKDDISTLQKNTQLDENNYIKFQANNIIKEY